MCEEGTPSAIRTCLPSNVIMFKFVYLLVDIKLR